MLLVTGATGQLGTATLEFLLQKMPAAQLAGLARNPEKAAPLKAKGVDMRLGDYDDYNSMVQAFAGVERLFLISSSNQEGKIAEHHRSAIQAATAAGVKHIFYTIGDIKNTHQTALAWREKSHQQTREVLQASGVPYTLFQNNLYAEVIPIYIGMGAVEQGIMFPAGDGRIPFARRGDMAEAAATILANPETPNAAYVMAAPTAYSFADIAAMLSEIAGKEVPYHKPDVEAYVAFQVAAGMPEGRARFMATFGQAMAAGDLDTGHTDLPAILGREPRTLQAYLQEVYGKTPGS